MEVISNPLNGEIMEISSCIQNTLDGDFLIDIEVQPESKRSGITGFNEWRNRLSVAVTAQAKVFGLEKSSIEIVGGHTSRMKKIKIVGKDVKQIIDSIVTELGE